MMVIKLQKSSLRFITHLMYPFLLITVRNQWYSALYPASCGEPNVNMNASVNCSPVKEVPILLIEFKYGQSAEEAMNQIKEKEYFSRYRDGVYPNDVLLIGINYNPKTKDHQCLIEKLDK